MILPATTWSVHTIEAPNCSDEQRGLYNEVRTASRNQYGRTTWRNSWTVKTDKAKLAVFHCFVGWALCSYCGIQKKSLDRAGKLSTIIRTSADGNLQEDESVEGDDDSTGGTRQVDREKEIYSRFLRGEEITSNQWWWVWWGFHHFLWRRRFTYRHWWWHWGRGGRGGEWPRWSCTTI